MWLSVTPTLLTHLKKVSLFVLWKISPTKSNIPSSGLEITLKVLSRNLLLSFQVSLKTDKNFWQNSKSNTNKTLQLLELSLNHYTDSTMQTRRKVMPPVSSWQLPFSKMFSTTKSDNFWLPSLLIMSSNRLENFSGVDWSVSQQL